MHTVLWVVYFNFGSVTLRKHIACDHWTTGDSIQPKNSDSSITAFKTAQMRKQHVHNRIIQLNALLVM